MNCKNIGFFLFCFATSLSFGQATNNPFDIEGRTADESILQDSTVQQTLNVFDIGSQEAESERGNPFDVSHIPEKKSDIRPSVTSRKIKKEASSFFDFQFWVMLFLSAFFAFLMFFFRNEIKSLTKPLFNANYLNMLKRISDGGQNTFFLSMYLFFFANLGVLSYNVLRSYTKLDGLLILFYCFLACMVLYLGKHLYLWLISYVFPLEKPIGTYSFTVVLFNAILGLILFPMNLLIVLGPENLRSELITASLVIVAIVFVLRILQGILNSARVVTGNIFHFFLYLCSSEIAPLTLIFGFISQS